MASSSTTMRSIDLITIDSKWGAARLLGLIQEHNPEGLQAEILTLERRLAQAPATDSLEQERQELLRGVLEDLCASPGQEQDVCLELLQHLCAAPSTGLAYLA